MAQVKFSKSVKFFICILHISDFIHKPSIAIDVRVLYCHRLIALKRHNEVFGIEHVQHREDAASIDLGHVSACLCDGGHGLLHLRTDVSINQFLVSAQLGSMISADTLMIETGFILVERVACKVQNTIVQGLVLQYLTVCLRHRLCLFAHALLYKHAVIEVAFVHLPHVGKTQNSNRYHHKLYPQLLHLVEEETQCADNDNPERPPTVGREYAFADASQVGQQWRKIFGRD